MYQIDPSIDFDSRDHFEQEQSVLALTCDLIVVMSFPFRATSVLSSGHGFKGSTLYGRLPLTVTTHPGHLYNIVVWSMVPLAFSWSHCKGH